MRKAVSVKNWKAKGMVEDRPLGSERSFFKGFLGGSLIGLGVFSLNFGVGIQAIIFIIGLIIVADAMITRTEEIYPISMLLGALVGFFIGLFSAAGMVNIYYTALILILGALVYLAKLMRKIRRR